MLIKIISFSCFKLFPLFLTLAFPFYIFAEQGSQLTTLDRNCLALNLVQFIASKKNGDVTPVNWRFRSEKVESYLPLVRNTVNCLNFLVHEANKKNMKFHFKLHDDPIGLSQIALSAFLESLNRIKLDASDQLPKMSCIEYSKADWIRCSNGIWECDQLNRECLEGTLKP